MADFGSARVGDKVWDLVDGEGVIDSIYTKEIKGLSDSIFVKFPSDGGRWYFYDGNGHVDSKRRLYWSEPEISDPPPPKRMKKVTMERWLVVEKAMVASLDGFRLNILLSEPRSDEFGEKEILREHFVREIEVPE